MMKVKVLSKGCADCTATYKLIEEVASENSIEIELEEVKDVQLIMAYGVMSTPGVIVNERVLYAGSVPDKKAILSWLQ